MKDRSGTWIFKWMPAGVLIMLSLLFAKHAWVNYASYHTLKEKLIRLEGKEKQLHAENDAIQGQLDRYQDPLNLEEKVKKELNLKKPDEKVLLIVNASETRRDIMVAHGTTTPSILEQFSSWWHHLFQ